MTDETAQNTAADIRSAATELVTLRDWLRFAVSNFSAAGLVYGHGTTNGLDEAAYLILTTLKLPIDAIDPWLDARLTSAERKQVADIIARRIETRRPASYLTGEAWIGPYRFHVDERVIVPRSLIGELLVGGFDGLFETAQPVARILDLCTGSGCLAILLADSFADARIIGADISERALEVAEINVAAHQLEDRVALVSSDLFSALQGERFDLIISNPPYVTSSAVAAFPPEYAAEPELAHAGGADGLSLVRRILDEAGAHLSDGGTLVVEIGLGREELKACYPDVAFQWLDTQLSEGEVFALSKEQLP